MNQNPPPRNPPLNPIQRLILRVFGHVKIGDYTRHGWSGTLPFYAFKCPVHGVVTDYKHGFKGRLSCPLCRIDREYRTA